MPNQAYSFIIFILNGLIIGLIFDIFRIFRKSFKTPDFITYLQDFIFWIIAGSILLYSIFKFNNGELRLYIFIGILLGVSAYILIFSRLFIKISVEIINFVKKVLFNLIVVPTKFVIKLLKKSILNPIMYITKKILSLFRFFHKKKQFNKIKIGKKKDFA